MNSDDNLRKIRQRIGNRRKELNMSYQDLAKKTGMSKSTLQRYETGDIGNVGLDKLEVLSKALQVDPAYLMGWDQESSSPKKAVRINVYGRIPAGMPIEAVEDIIDWEEIPIEWTKGNKQYIALEVQGDSMYPKYLDKDIVIILLQPDCETGDDCACYVNGYDTTLKSIIKGPNEITLKPINPQYPPKTYKHPGEVQIVGKVVELRRKI